MTAVHPSGHPAEHLSGAPIDASLATAPVPLRPIWLSHHDDCHADRCVYVRSVPVCRRCLAMFVGFLPAAILLSTSWRHGLEAGDKGLALALTIVAGIEFLQVASRRISYSPRRVLLLSPAVGAVVAWLGVTGVQDGMGPAHLAFGATALVVLLALFRTGTYLDRTGQERTG